ncbi:MAG TPA: HlyD family efflux transporter periplasmic adaptor subunit [Arenimonas sp.]|nr:HlyD family efflux transporter periplasmic adaptor subunit [Arenimonas sp.]
MSKIRIIACLILLAGCSSASHEPLLGTLEWDRISVPAESSERIVRWFVKEGDTVRAGQLILEMDKQRIQAKIANAQALLDQAKAQLAELSHGTRIEDLDAARAELSSVQAVQVDARHYYTRQAELARKQYVSQSAVDSAKANRDKADAAVASAQARLQALIAGPRSEQILQAEAAVKASQANMQLLQISLQKMLVHAPRDGRVDAIPFKPGDQPPAGAGVVSLLVGKAPYARVFVPASSRERVKVGQNYIVYLQDNERAWKAHIRYVSSDAAFTPYYALTGDDASRLVYRAELVLDESDARALPAGLSVQAQPVR